jgi:hypothetical protein
MTDVSLQVRRWPFVACLSSSTINYLFRELTGDELHTSDDLDDPVVDHFHSVINGDHPIVDAGHSIIDTGHLVTDTT